MRKPQNWTKRDAEAFLIQMLYTIGEGFDPDTDPMDYVFTDENGVQCCTFTDGKEIRRMREGIARAREFFPDDEVELYEFLSQWKERIYPHGGEFSVTVDYEGCEEPETFTFPTLAEQKAFIAGMEAIDATNYIHTITEIIP